MENREIFTASLQLKKILSEVSQSWHLSFVVDAPISFIPGQFFSVLAERAYPEGHPKAGQVRQDTRAYSIASAPSGNKFDLCVNCVDGGFFSHMLCGMEPGGTIQFHGPHGNFTLREDVGAASIPILILAEDTGIAPVRSMLQATPGLQAHLIQSSATDAQPLYGDEIAAMRLPGYTPLLEEGTYARSLAAVKAVLEAEPRIREAYIVGLSGFVNAHRAHLKELGWDRKQIVFERYD